MKKNLILNIIQLISFIVMSIVVVVFIIIFIKGYKELSFEFLSQPPIDGMTKGGIFPAIIGTFSVTVVMMLFSVPFGVGAAIYLNEYAKDNFLTRLIKLTVRNLSGVPSIIYGLFGVAIFCNMMNLGRSILASGLTLGLLTLPWIIASSEKALSRVPKGYKNGALALGATKWTMISTIALPCALPGILTGIILGMSRAAGETAPILFTGVTFSMMSLPHSFYDKFMALPYHLYVLATQHHDIHAVLGKAWATALVLIALIFMLNLIAFYLRNKYEKS